jgi:hypothetical protein
VSVSSVKQAPANADTPAASAVELHPITAADLMDVARFLHAELNPRIPVERWAAEIVPTWRVSQPNHGFLLRHRGAVVGAHLAFYSEREIAGGTERFCNLAAWCVAEPYRSHGVRLLRALLRQRGYHFTDLSPSETVQALNIRLGFRAFDTSTVVVSHVPRHVRSRGVRVLSKRAEIERILQGEQLSRYLDHVDASAVNHAVIVRGTETCHVVYRRMRRKNLAVFAQLLYVGNRALFEAEAAHLFRHLLLRRGMLATLIESQVVETTFERSTAVSPRAKMYRSDSLGAGQIDYLYSELTCMRW